MKVLCYGVRDVERPTFENSNKEYGYDLTLVPDYLEGPETAELAKGYDAVILRANCFANKQNLDIYKKLGVKYLLTRTAGVEHIDVPYAKQLGFKMGYVPAYSPNAVAELAVTQALMLQRHTAYAVSRTARKNFVVDSPMYSKEVRNCTVGVLGLGRIGRIFAQIFHGFGATVIGSDLFPAKGIEGYATQVSTDELVARADIISIHMPYIKENGTVLTRELINKMKPGVILVNCSRGPLVDTDAVIDAIESGRMDGYAADTLTNEDEVFGQDLEGQEIRNAQIAKLVSLYPRVLITPHIGSDTDEAVKNMIEISYQNLKELSETGDCKFPIK